MPLSKFARQGGIWNAIKQHARNNPELVGAAIGGPTMGYLGYRVGKSEEAKAKSTHGKTYRQHLPFGKHHAAVRGVASAISGAVTGASFGHSYRLSHEQGSYRSHGGHYEAPRTVETPDFVKGLKTKREAEKAFRDVAFKLHPDRGGDPEKFKDISAKWTEFKKSKKFEKLSHLIPSFFDELKDI